MKPGPLTLGDLLDYIEKNNIPLAEARNYEISFGISDDYNKFELARPHNDWPRINAPWKAENGTEYRGAIRLDGHLCTNTAFMRRKEKVRS